MRRLSLTWYLFPFFVVITFMVMGAVTWYAARSWRLFFLDQTYKDLETRARLVESRVAGDLSPEHQARIDKLCKELGVATATRLTVILSNGVVVGD